VKAYFSPGSTQATAVKLVDVGNLVLDDLEPDRPILWTNETTDLPPAFSCYVFNHVPLPVGMELQIYDTDYGPPWGKSESVSPDSTWSVQPPAGTLEKYHIYTYKFWGQQNYADWYTNPRPIFNSLSAYLAKPVDPPFDPDEQEMWANLEYQLGEQAGSLDWDAYDPLLNELTPLASPPPAMPTGPPGQALVCPGDVDLSWPIYGGRYHWVVSGMASKMERDHVFLPIKDEGACIVMQPKARNYDTPLLSNTAPIARDAQQDLTTDVPDGQYAATAVTDAPSGVIMDAFEKAAIVCFDGHADDHDHWVGEHPDQGPADPHLGWIYTCDGVVYSKPPPDPPPDGPGPSVADLVNAHQCHLAVFYTCLAGDDFQATLPGKGVDCVVGPNNVDLYNGDISITWFQTFWQYLRYRSTVGVALIKAAEQIYLHHRDDQDRLPDATESWNTDLISSTNDDERIWPARYE